MIKIITDKKEKDTLTKMYFHGITARALEEFSKKSGYGDDFLGIHFKEYLEDEKIHLLLNPFELFFETKQ